MKNINNKGFTLVEILATIVILGILSATAIGAVTKYIGKAEKKSYDTMAHSAANAAENYIMDSKINYLTSKSGSPDYVNWSRIKDSNYNGYLTRDSSYYLTFEELVKEGYLKDTEDPAKRNGSSCVGRVYVYYEPAKEDRQLDIYSFIVHEWCSQYSARYLYFYEKNDKGELESKTKISTRNDVVGDKPTS